MRSVLACTLPLTLALSVSAHAQDQEGQAVRDEPNALDVAMTPLTDLNIAGGEIPELLLAAQESPYSLEGLDDCASITAEVAKFDALLGDDFDLPRDMPGSTSVGAIGQAAVGSFIPFRGLVREVSGAKGRERALSIAVQAGYARRGFLKGAGQAKGCRYPARPATENDIQQIQAERQEVLEEESED
jgi:hypothetical protein